MVGSLGSKYKALDIFRKSQRIPAYQHFLKAQHISHRVPFHQVPQTDKKSYILRYDYSELRSLDSDTEFTLFRSSGSSGKAVFWPQIRKPYTQLVSGLKGMLESSYGIHQKRTLAIVGLALGSWVGGDCFSWSLKNLAMQVPYPFTVFSPGNNHDEIIEIIQKYNSLVDQFLILMCPSAIGHLHLKARDQGVALPHAKIRYLVLGEPFPENLRINLQKQAGLQGSFPILSLYGSADTGTLGVESQASAALRQLLCCNQALREHLNIPYPVPHFFHFVAPQTYLEVENQELLVTKWQGIPLVRYNLHDRASLYTWSQLLEQLMTSGCIEPEEEPLLKLILQSSHFCRQNWMKKWYLAQPHLGDLIAISGRTDACLILCGTNFTEEMLNEALHTAALSAFITDRFYAKVSYIEDRQFLCLDIEVLHRALLTSEIEDQIYRILIKELGRVQPEFLQDWQHVYTAWDDIPEKRILKLTLHAWPALSKQSELRIKNRGI